MMCPVCGVAPLIRRHGRALLTCGAAACATELRTQRLRGRVYGKSRAPKPRNAVASYGAVHTRARRAFAGRPCALLDDTCQGRIEMALRLPVPNPDLLRIDTRGPYYAGVETEQAYRPLCRSHHGREGRSRAALRVVEGVLARHEGEPWVASLRAEIQAAFLHVIPRGPDDGLPKRWPWIQGGTPE